MQKKTFHDIQNYMFQQNNERTIECQQTKDMNNIWTNINFTFEEMDLRSIFSLHILIEHALLVMIIKIKAKIYGVTYLVKIHSE